MLLSTASSSSVGPGAVPNTRSFSDVQPVPTFACTGNGLNASQCSVNTGTCNLYSGVVCQGKIHTFDAMNVIYLHVAVTWTDLASTHGASCSDGDIRLNDGPSVREGRVEVCFNNAWGTVCAYRSVFTSVNANVVCRQYFPSSIITGEIKITSVEDTLVFTYNHSQMHGLSQFLLGVVPYT